MDILYVQKIFSQNQLGKVDVIEKIEIGFTNRVYSINNEYILKVCEFEENEENFENEVFLYHFFENTLPVPKVIIYDVSKRLLDKHFMIYRKIQGINLYSEWHVMSDGERKEVIRQLCKILKEINEADYSEFLKHYTLSNQISWRDKICTKILNSIEKLKMNKGILSDDFLKHIKIFVTERMGVLEEQKIALVYWDAHFDNVLIAGNKIVGLLDFERTELSSIDFVLDVFKRMMDYPKKYISEDYKKYAKHKDYAKLFIWLEEFYPELFAFDYLSQRLALYSIEHDLSTLVAYPNCRETKQMIVKTIGFQGDL